MELNELIKLSIAEATQLMPSTGASPFALVCLESKDFPDIVKKFRDVSQLLLFVLVKTDFSEEDIEDYAKKSKEYQTIPESNKDAFVQMFRLKCQKSQELKRWKEMVANIATGLILHVAKTKDIYFDPINVDLSDLKELSRFNEENLTAYQIYNTYLID